MRSPGRARWRRRLLLGSALLALCAAPAHARDESRRTSPELGRQVYDAAVLRPLGLVQTLVGAAFFLVAYPVSLVTGGSEDVLEICITGPVEQTFRRPLGGR